MRKRLFAIIPILVSLAACTATPKTDNETTTTSYEENIQIEESTAATTIPKAPQVSADAEISHYTNPLIWADAPDPSVIRVGDVYYMTSTTMHYAPGCPIMRSYDLVNWEIVNYVYDILEDDDTSAMRNGKDSYSKGSWASSIRYNDGTFYVMFAAYNTGKTYIYQTEDIENGPWRKYSFDGVYHDMSLLFDDDGKVYIVYGGGTIKIIELNQEVTDLKLGGLKKDLIDTKPLVGENPVLNAEGAHMYKIDGKYYIFLIAWTERRLQICYRSDTIDGEYEGRIVYNDNIGYNNSGVAQGGVVQTVDGSWYGLLFQDHGAVGRVPALIPVVFEDGWPVFDPEGIAGGEIPIPVPGHEVKNIVASDEFDGDALKKDFSASNINVYKYDTGEGNNTFKETDIIINGDFNASDNSWQNGTASTVTFSGNSAVVEEEKGSDFGIMQDLSRKIVRGNTYEISTDIEYLNGAPSALFEIYMKHGDSDPILLTSKTINKGDSASLLETFIMGTDIDISKNILYIKADGGDKNNYKVNSVKLINKGKKLDKSKPGEYDYNGASLGLVWQWNHNPDNNNWSLTANPGFMRITNARVSQNITGAKNILTQRSFGPECTGSIAIETENMKNGDTAGLAAFQYNYGYVGVQMIGGKKQIVMVNRSSENPVIDEIVPINQDRVYLKVKMDFNNNSDRAYFYYSLDGEEWISIGEHLKMNYSLNHFTGYRFALFNFAEQETGGYVDFDYFRLEEI